MQCHFAMSIILKETTKGKNKICQVNNMLYFTTLQSSIP